jgi:glucose-1-phosphate cytidylyltransferase
VNIQFRYDEVMTTNMPAVILAGGLGTRIREETEFRPKPMVEIGGRPILWHIMKHLSFYGVDRFVICVGYKGDLIRDYFLNYRARNNDFTVSLGEHQELNFHSTHEESSWSVTVAETGAESNTGERVRRIRTHIPNERFLCTYGDGLADLDIRKLQQHHMDNQKIATVTAVRPLSRFGLLELDEKDKVVSFKEKPKAEGWINGGYFIFEPQIFDYLSPNQALENEPLQKLTQAGELSAFKHEGFWQPMDTYRESLMLNELWRSGEAPWKTGMK